MGSQEARVLDILSDGRWHCGNEFLEAHMPRYSAVIHTIRHKRGYVIEGERCTIHTWDRRGHAPHMFRIVSYPSKYVRGEQTSWLE